jgi:tetratricopeptide (TPR) repeat protein
MQNPNVFASLNQRLSWAYQLGNQAVACEQMGNYPGALSQWEQTMAAIGGSMGEARLWAVPVPDSVHFSYGQCHYYTARAKVMLGRGPEAGPLLEWALQEAYWAIDIKSNDSRYHAFAGAVLLCKGRHAAADAEFRLAVKLNPDDAWSHWMLAWIQQQWYGNPNLAIQHWGAALQLQPTMPPTPSLKPGGIADTLTALKPYVDFCVSVLQFAKAAFG